MEMPKTKTVDEKIDELAQSVKVGFDAVDARMVRLEAIIQSVREDLQGEIHDLRVDMNYGFSRIDKKFIEVDSRLDILEAR